MYTLAGNWPLVLSYRYAEDIAKVQKQYKSEPFKFLEPRFAWLVFFLVLYDMPITDIMAERCMVFIHKSCEMSEFISFYKGTFCLAKTY